MAATSSKVMYTSNAMAISQPSSERGIIWYNDGNIVIQASSTLFRVHCSVLAHNSEVLRDMFLMPQPPCVDEGDVEGCPVVQMHDRVEDWIHVLSAMYGR